MPDSGARLAAVTAGGAYGQVPFTVALFVLPVLYTIPGTRPLLSRHRWTALAVQAALTWVPLAVFGSNWQLGIDGLLAGLILLVVPGRVSWLVAGGLLVAEVIVRVIVAGVPVSPGWYAVVAVAAYYADDALVFFALVRLAQIVDEVAEARGKAAQLAVATERLEAAQSLRAAVGEHLAGISAKTAAARHALRSDPELAREQVAAAGTAARAAVAQAREVSARHLDIASRGSARLSAGNAVIGARLAWAVLVAVVSLLAMEGIGFVASSRYDVGRTALAIGVIALASAVQLYHSSAARRGRKARGWPLTLGLQVVLAYAFLFPFIHAYAGFLGPFAAGSILLLVPGRGRWAGYAAVVVSFAVLYAVELPAAANVGRGLLASVVYLVAVSAELGLLVYGLAWLAGLALQLQALNSQLARMAVVQERLRIARDVHDLLGLGLSAMALKADLVGRLIGRDDAWADAEIADLSRICAAVRAEVRLVTSDGQRLSLAAELAVARQILASAGIAVRATITEEQRLAAADDVLAPVLREAVTNILRHSSASACLIEATACAGVLTLRVANDGVTPPPPAAQAGAGDRTGRGLANLAARVQSAGGRFASGCADGQFHVMAELPGPGDS